MQNKNIIINNLRINYYQNKNFKAQDKSIIFLHGWQSDALVFSGILEKLEKENKNFISIDLPGFAKSEKAKNIWGVEDYAKFLKDFLEKLNIEKKILVGHSFGGAVIIKYLAKYRDKETQKAILVASAGIRKRGLQIFLLMIFTKIFKIFFSLPILNLFFKKVRKKYYQLIDAEDYYRAGDMKEIYQKIIREDLQADMKKIDTKTTLIWGENDKSTSVEDGKKTSRLIKNSYLFVLKDAGHFVFLDQKEEFEKIFFYNLA